MVHQGQTAQSLQEKASPGRQTQCYIFPESPCPHNPLEPSNSHMPGIVKTVAMLGARTPSQKMILKPWAHITINIPYKYINYKVYMDTKTF